MELNTYTFINEALIDSYFFQLPNELRKKDFKVKKSISFSLGGPKVSASQEVDDKELSYVEKISIINRVLLNSDSISLARPVEAYDSWGNIYNPPRESDNTRFVLESFSAKKVIIPTGKNFKFPHVKYIVVWVSDPDPGIYTEEEFVWRGSFLYLVQIMEDQYNYQSVISGVSALQALSNIIDGRPFFEFSKCKGEPLGRWSNKHPLDKLVDLGGEVSDERQLTSLYKKRYITDEQCYEYDGEKRRVNDLLAYPLWIKEKHA
ncbi:hypothetical protein [Pseudoalteromonas sp. 68 DY56-GL68]|uniref:hypothetical protein n=1 Tax=Pseudoalteromonas sp. 68 DY56-GL68 TaxID=2974919 RepID=UPI00352B430F